MELESDRSGSRLQLRIAANDPDELVWRIHDVVELIQTGELPRLVNRLRGRQ